MTPSQEQVEESVAFFLDYREYPEIRRHVEVLVDALRESKERVIDLERQVTARIDMINELRGDVRTHDDLLVNARQDATTAEAELANWKKRCGPWFPWDSQARKRLATLTQAALEHECPGDGSTDQRCYMKRCSITAALHPRTP